MNKKGFTLVEILGVLIILCIILALVFTTTKNIIKQGKDVTSQTQINKILTSAYDYSLKNTNYLPETGDKKFITLAELKNIGYIDYNITNPNTGKLFPDNLVISIDNVGSGYKYSNPNSFLKGNYLYTVELDSLNNLNNLPTINLSGLTKNSSGNYVVTLNLNSTYIDYEYDAIDYTHNNITDRVKINKYFNNEIVDDIDILESGLYKITYTVVDDFGNSSLVVLSIIVADTEAPNIFFEESTRISKVLDNYDLMKDVSCMDNSEICNITYTGTINYKTPGKYIIEYKAQDPSGNTSTKKRVITIE